MDLICLYIRLSVKNVLFLPYGGSGYFLTRGFLTTARNLFALSRTVKWLFLGCNG